MAHPIFVWRLDELESKRTLYTEPDTQDELKIQQETYQVWLEASGYVRVENRQDNGTWKVVEHYRAEISSHAK